MENNKIWLSSPHMGGTEIKYINEAFASNWIAPIGPNIKAFEEDIANYLGYKNYPVVLSSGTAAIHLSLVQLGVKTDDEVICQSLTFCGTVNPVIYQGARPIFIDSEKDTWNMCPNALESAIKDRLSKGKIVKAIIPVHLYGMPANMTDILNIANRYGIPVIEDAAEALGSKFNGLKCGTMGHFSILSFNGNKIITSSGGGALISRTQADANNTLFLSTQARDEAPHYEHSVVGYNYRMSNICAGIGKGQMEVLENRVQERRNNFNRYKTILSKYDVEFQNEPSGAYSNRWLTAILINTSKSENDTDYIRDSFSRKNIETRPVWKPMHLQPVFKDYPYYGSNNSEMLFDRGLCLPSGSNLSEDDWARIENAIDCFF